MIRKADETVCLLLFRGIYAVKGCGTKYDDGSDNTDKTNGLPVEDCNQDGIYDGLHHGNQRGCHRRNIIKTFCEENICHTNLYKSKQDDTYHVIWGKGILLNIEWYSDD